MVLVHPGDQIAFRVVYACPCDSGDSGRDHPGPSGLRAIYTRLLDEYRLENFAIVTHYFTISAILSCSKGVCMSPLQTVKLSLIDHLGLAKDALHIYVGLALFFGTMVIMRWHPAQKRPLIIVALAALAGEAWDIRDSLTYATPIRLSANWHDVWNTLFWPTIIFTLARVTPIFSEIRTPARGEASQSDPA